MLVFLMWKGMERLSKNSKASFMLACPELRLFNKTCCTEKRIPEGKFSQLLTVVLCGGGVLENYRRHKFSTKFASVSISFCGLL